MDPRGRIAGCMPSEHITRHEEPQSGNHGRLAKMDSPEGSLSSRALAPAASRTHPARGQRITIGVTGHTIARGHGREPPQDGGPVHTPSPPVIDTRGEWSGSAPSRQIEWCREHPGGARGTPPLNGQRGGTLAREGSEEVGTPSSFIEIYNNSPRNRLRYLERIIHHVLIRSDHATI